MGGGRGSVRMLLVLYEAYKSATRKVGTSAKCRTCGSIFVEHAMDTVTKNCRNPKSKNQTNKALIWYLVLQLVSLQHLLFSAPETDEDKRSPGAKLL